MLNLTWEQLFDGNSKVTRYEGHVTEHETQRNFTVHTNNVTKIDNFRLVANRRYTVRVRAKNSIGFSNYSDPISFVMDNVTGKKKHFLDFKYLLVLNSIPERLF